MRLGLAAAALAALTLAAPAAAQPGAVDVMRGVVRQLADNAEGVQDYTLTLRAAGMSTDVYVYRDGDEWEVAAPDDDGMGEMLEGLVVWPSFGDMGDEFPDTEDVSEADLQEFGRIFNLSSETLNGRPAHVLFVRMGELGADSEMPDSLRMYIDPATHQILRVHVAGASAEMGEMAPGGGGMEVTMDFTDYRETDGLTIPHALRMLLEVELNLTDAQRETMRQGVAEARSELAGDDSPEAKQTAAMIDVFLGLLTEGRLELPVTVENVRVNTGPPTWFEG